MLVLDLQSDNRAAIARQEGFDDFEVILDKAECGMEAYPEFGSGSQTL